MTTRKVVEGSPQVLEVSGFGVVRQGVAVLLGPNLIPLRVSSYSLLCLEF